MSTEPEFPRPIEKNHRLYFDSHEVENYKRRLIGLPETTRDPAARIQLRTAKDVAAELGFGRRTLGRRIAGRSGGEAA